MRVSDGTSMKDVLSDWCDVVSLNSSSEEIVILFLNKTLTSSQAVAFQRTALSVQSELSVVSLAMSVAGRWHRFSATELVMLNIAMECHGRTESIKFRCRGGSCSLLVTFPHAKLDDFFDVNLGGGRFCRGERSCKTHLCSDHHSRHVHPLFWVRSVASLSCCHRTVACL